MEPVQENRITSHKNVIRGLHYQTYPYEQAKLVRVERGKICDVCVDIRKGPSYGTVHYFILDEKDNQLLYIPKGFAHGFSILEDDTVISYKTDNYYSKSHEKCINPLDDTLKIKWNVENPIISDKDKFAQAFNHS